MKLKPSLDWLLVFVPLAVCLEFFTSDKGTWIFICSCLAIIPLAGWMGKATEHLAERTGDGIGGLLNATFGNAAELIIALMALSQGQYVIVKASITGSIVGNILLILGIAEGARVPIRWRTSFRAEVCCLGSTMRSTSVRGDSAVYRCVVDQTV